MPDVSLLHLVRAVPADLKEPAFDPKPFIRNFEAAVDRLIEVRRDVQAKTEQLEKTVRIAEREYSKKMGDLNKGFEVRPKAFTTTARHVIDHSMQSVGQSFASMEGKMDDVSSTAIRIGESWDFACQRVTSEQSSSGEQLETVHTERQRAQAAYDIIDYYNQFAREDTFRLDALRKEGKEGRRQVAVILRRLNIVAKEVDLPSAEKVRKGCFWMNISRILCIRQEKGSKSTARSSKKICYIYSIDAIAKGIQK